MIFRLVKREKATIEADKYNETYVVQVSKLGDWEDLIETEDLVDGVVMLTNVRKLGGFIKDTHIEV